MIDALKMDQVAVKMKPHTSHTFGSETSTIVACASDDRFGSIRTCKCCGGREVWAGGAGSHYFDAKLLKACNR